MPSQVAVDTVAFDDDPAELARLRRRVGRLLAGYSDDAVYRAKLVADELAASAVVQHSPGTVALRLDRQHHQLRIEVRTGRRTPAPCPAIHRRLSAEWLIGREILEGCTHDWGISMLGHYQRAWADIVLDDAPGHAP